MWWILIIFCNKNIELQISHKADMFEWSANPIWVEQFWMNSFIYIMMCKQLNISVANFLLFMVIQTQKRCNSPYVYWRQSSNPHRKHIQSILGINFNRGQCCTNILIMLVLMLTRHAISLKAGFVYVGDEVDQYAIDKNNLQRDSSC